MAAVRLDQEGPFLELGVAGEERGLESEEGGVGVVGWEGEGESGGGVQDCSAGETRGCCGGHEKDGGGWSFVALCDEKLSIGCKASCFLIDKGSVSGLSRNAVRLTKIYLFRRLLHNTTVEPPLTI